jgi:hypothetical protein
VKTDKVAEFGAQIGAAPKGALDERISFDVIKVDGPLAIVWTPYQFYYNGTFSHCGVNSFQMLRTAGFLRKMWREDQQYNMCIWRVMEQVFKVLTRRNGLASWPVSRWARSNRPPRN